jgi:hypothetical protein
MIDTCSIQIFSGNKMKHLFIILPLVIILITSSCSTEQNPTNYIYSDPNYTSCMDNEESILSSPGCEDAPILNRGVGIETGDVHLSWTDLLGASFYELEECYCPDFSSEIYYYQLTESYFVVDWRTPTYFRVRAVIYGTPTGWSNVKKNSYYY